MPGPDKGSCKVKLTNGGLKKNAADETNHLLHQRVLGGK